MHLSVTEIHAARQLVHFSSAANSSNWVWDTDVQGCLYIWIYVASLAHWLRQWYKFDLSQTTHASHSLFMYVGHPAGTDLWLQKSPFLEVDMSELSVLKGIILHSSFVKRCIQLQTSTKCFVVVVKVLRHPDCNTRFQFSVSVNHDGSQSLLHDTSQCVYHWKRRVSHWSCSV